MSRFTKSNLIATLEDINEKMKSFGSKYSFHYSARNGYHAVDLHCDGKSVRNIDCNEPPRILAERAEDESEYYLNLA